jgi:hypothetical protein
MDQQGRPDGAVAAQVFDQLALFGRQSRVESGRIDQFLDRRFQRRIQNPVRQGKALQDVAAQLHRYGPIEVRGQIRSQFGATQQRPAQRRHSAGGGDQPGQGGFRQFGARIVQQGFDRGRTADFDQRLANRSADPRAGRNDNPMGIALSARDSDQVGIGQLQTAQQDGPGDFDGVVGQHDDQAVRRVRFVGQPFGQCLPDLDLGIVQNVQQNIDCKDLFALAQIGPGRDIEFADGIGQPAPARRRPVTGNGLEGGNRAVQPPIPTVVAIELFGHARSRHSAHRKCVNSPH